MVSQEVIVVRGHGPEVARVPCVQGVSKPPVLEKWSAAYVWRDRAEVDRQTHILEVVGSIPTPAIII